MYLHIYNQEDHWDHQSTICHVKDLQQAWDQCTAASDADDSSTIDADLELDCWVFDAPPVAVETNNDNTEYEVPLSHGGITEDVVPLL